MPATPPEPPAASGYGVLFVIIATLGFASKGIFIKLSYQLGNHIDAITVMAFRMIIALPFFLITAWYLERREGRVDLSCGDYLRIVYLGFMGYYLSSLLDLSGLQHISASLERLILYLYPTFVVLLTAYLARRRIHMREIFALGLSYLGLGFVFTSDLADMNRNILHGSLLILAAAFSFALFMVASHGMVRRIGAARTTALSMSVAALFTIIHYLLVHGSMQLHQAPAFYWYGLSLALFGTVIPSFLMNAGLHRVGPGRTAILTSIGPIMTLGLAFLYLGEKLSLVQFLGALLILGGVYIAGRKTAPA